MLHPTITALINAIQRWRGPMRDDHTLCKAADAALPALLSLQNVRRTRKSNPLEATPDVEFANAVADVLNNQAAEIASRTDDPNAYYEEVGERIIAAATHLEFLAFLRRVAPEAFTRQTR